jgi:hypothetical protein
VPVRAGPVFRSTLNATEPLPVPDAPFVTISHVAFELAVHVHVPAEAVTAIDPDVAVSPTFCEVGEIANVHGGGGGGGGAGAAACVTVKVCPAMVNVPLRAAAVLAAIWTPTAPVPAADAPLVTVSHAAFDAAVHAQLFADAVTATETEPPVSPTSCVVGEIEKVHGGGGGGGGGGAACCDTAKVLPATAIEALRAVVVVLGAMVMPTLPLPLPALPARLIQDALVVAVHAHVFADAETAIEPDPPASVNA